MSEPCYRRSRFAFKHRLMHADIGDCARSLTRPEVGAEDFRASCFSHWRWQRSNTGPSQRYSAEAARAACVPTARPKQVAAMQITCLCMTEPPWNPNLWDRHNSDGARLAIAMLQSCPVLLTNARRTFACGLKQTTKIKNVTSAFGPKADIDT